QSRPSSRQLASTRRRSGAPRRAARSAAEIRGLSGMAARLRPASGLRQRQLDHVRAAEAETGLAIGEIEAPQAAETLVEAGHAADLGPGGLEALVPQPEGLGVVAAEALHRAPGEARAIDHRPQRRLGGQHAAREDVLLDEVGALAVAAEVGVLDGDDLQAGLAARLQHLVDLAEIGGPVLLPHGLE